MKMTLKVSLFHVTKKKRLSVAAQTVSSSTASNSMESLKSTDPAPNPLTILDPELRDFCTCLHITPVAREFHDQKDESDPHLCVSDQSSGIEEESSLMALKTFSNAFRKGQVAALQKENKKKKGRYSKQSKKTLQHRAQACDDSISKGFHPLDEYIRIKAKKKKLKELTQVTPELDNVINVREESEESSDEANLPA